MEMGDGLGGCILHEAVVAFDVGYQFVYFCRLGGRFVHLAVALERVGSEETQAVAENIEIILVVGLALAQQACFQSFFTLIGVTFECMWRTSIDKSCLLRSLKTSDCLLHSLQLNSLRFSGQPLILCLPLRLEGIFIN